MAEKEENYETFSDKDANDNDDYTVEEAIEKCGFGAFQIKLSIITGFAWMADSMEVMVISIIGPVLVCEWFLTTPQEALISTIVFFGMMVGSPALGYIGDAYGRKTSLIFSALWALYYGILSSITPEFIWLLILRGLLGFGVGGVPQAVTYYSEFLPSKARGKCLVLIEVAWSFGAMIEVILAIVILLPFGWRWWLLASAIPLFAFALMCLWLPESPRFDMAAGNRARAQRSLERVAKTNGQTLPKGRIRPEPQSPMGGFLDLLVPAYRRTTILLWFIWFVGAFSYYGVVLMSTQLISTGSTCNVDGLALNDVSPCMAGCKTLEMDDYIELLWTSTAELPGLLGVVFLIDILGRKATMALGFALFAITCFLLNICIEGGVLVFMLFVARALAAAAFQVVYVYTPEVYPTKMRGIGIGVGCSFSRLGALITPFIATILLQYSVLMGMAVYGSLGLLAAIASLLLPIETKGRALEVIEE